MPDCSRKSRLLWRCSRAGGPIGWRRFWTRGEIITNWARRLQKLDAQRNSSHFSRGAATPTRGRPWSR